MRRKLKALIQRPTDPIADKVLSEVARRARNRALRELLAELNRDDPLDPEEVARARARLLE